ncbi:MAG: Lrp/AsnC family transcriptional regulator [Hadesarchaea archaeon]|nr:Lrp/AsnC family transcriptional regulator [Hadesarchaea archaeon]
MADLDELDLRILRAMGKGVGVGPKLTELAREIGEPRSTVNLRVETLEEEGVITGYAPRIDWAKLGYPIFGYIGIVCHDEVLEGLLKILKKEESVVEVHEVTTGSFDLLLKCRFKSYEGINELREKILRVEGVKDMDIWLLGPCHKEE